MNNFRCFKKCMIHFEPGVNIISGPNAIGKTTVLEAIHVLCLTKSNRTSRDQELIMNGSIGFEVSGVLKKEGLITNVGIFYSNKNKRVKINNYLYRTISEFIGMLNVVAFVPSDLFLFLGSPLIRRRELDLMLCQISRKYMIALSQYNKLLKERNYLLKEFENIKDAITLIGVITDQLFEEGSTIISYRDSFIKKVNTIIYEKHLMISDKREKLFINYVPSVNTNNYKNTMIKALPEDIKKKITTYGPHRDDYTFHINGKNVSEYGSQGQKRNAILSTKLAFVDLIYDTKKEYPMLLLDDVFSELDKKRQNSLIKTLDKNVQTIITTSTLSDIDEDLLKTAKLIKLNSGGENNGGY